MLPVVASVNTFNYQTPLVNTTLPGNSSIARVPPDNVAPSVSNVEVDNNNANGNTIVSSTTQQEQAVAQSTSAGGTAAFVLSQSGSVAQNSGVQSTFVAQLAAQDDNSPEFKGVLQQYEKQLAISNVKYAPSDALKPQPEPASVFGKILASERAAPQEQQQQVEEQVHTQIIQQSVAVSTAAHVVEQAPAIAVAQTQATPRVKEPENRHSGAAHQAPADESSLVDHFSSFVSTAYTATAGRVGSFNGPALELA